MAGLWDSDRAASGLRASDTQGRQKLSGDGQGLAFKPSGDNSRLVDSTGSGQGLRNPDTGAADGAGTGTNWGQIAQMVGQALQSGSDGAMPVAQQADVSYRDPKQYHLGEDYQPSSKRLKDRKGPVEKDPIKRGISGSDPIDQNGMTIKAIQDMSKRLDLVLKRIDALEKRG
jgi:hypothetical protein